MKKKTLFLILFVLGALALTVAFTVLNKSAAIVLTSIDTATAHLDSISPFPDVSPNSDSFDAITYLKQQGVLKGNKDGTFQPTSKLNRAEWATILTRMKNVEPNANEFKNCFPDVKNEWFAPYVCYAKKEGWVTGFKSGELAGKFGPNLPLKDVEVLVTLSRIFVWPLSEGQSSPFSGTAGDTWYAPALNYAIKHDIYSDDVKVVDLNREKMADMLFRSVAVQSADDGVQRKEFSKEVADELKQKDLHEVVKMGASDAEEDAEESDSPPPAESGGGSGNNTDDDSPTGDEAVKEHIFVCDLPGAICSPRPLKLKMDRKNSMEQVEVILKKVGKDRATISFDGKEKKMKLFDAVVKDNFIMTLVDVDDTHEIAYVYKNAYPQTNQPGGKNLAEMDFTQDGKKTEFLIKEVVTETSERDDTCTINYMIAVEVDVFDVTSLELILKKKYPLVESGETVEGECKDESDVPEDTVIRIPPETSTSTDDSSPIPPANTAPKTTSVSKDATSTNTPATPADNSPKTITFNEDSLYHDSTKIRKMEPIHSSTDGRGWISTPPKADDVKKFTTGYGSEVVDVGQTIEVKGTLVTVAKTLKNGMLQIEVFNPLKAKPYETYVLNLYEVIEINGQFMTNGGAIPNEAGYLYVTDILPKDPLHLFEILPRENNSVKGARETVTRVYIESPTNDPKVDDMIKLKVTAWNADGKSVNVQGESLVLVLAAGYDERIRIPLINEGFGEYSASFSTSWAGNYGIYVDNGATYAEGDGWVTTTPGDPATVDMEVTKEQVNALFKDTQEIEVRLLDKYSNVISSNINDYEVTVDGPGRVIGKYSSGGKNFINVKGEGLEEVKLTVTYKGKVGIQPKSVKPLKYNPLLLDYDPGRKATEEFDIGVDIWVPENEGSIKSYEVEIEYNTDHMKFIGTKVGEGEGAYDTFVSETAPGRLTVNGGSEIPDRNFIDATTLRFSPLVGTVGVGVIFIPDMVVTVIKDTEKVIRMPESSGWGESVQRWWYEFKPVKEIGIDVWIVEGTGVSRGDVMADINKAADIFSYAAGVCSCPFWLNFKVNFQPIISLADWRTKVDIAGGGRHPDSLDDTNGEEANLKNNFTANANNVQVWYVPDIFGPYIGTSYPNNGGISMDNSIDNDNRALAHELMHQVSGNKIKDPTHPNGAAQGANDFGNTMSYDHTGDTVTKIQCDLVKTEYPYK